MIVLAILCTLAALAVPCFISFREKAKVAAALSDLKTIDKKLQDYFALNGVYPATLAAVGLGNFKDPWGTPYVYLRVAGAPASLLRRDRNSQPVNSDFDLYSMGADRLTDPGFNDAAARDDIVRASNGGYYGLVSNY